MSNYGTEDFGMSAIDGMAGGLAEYQMREIFEAVQEAVDTGEMTHDQAADWLAANAPQVLPVWRTAWALEEAEYADPPEPPTLAGWDARQAQLAAARQAAVAALQQEQALDAQAARSGALVQALEAAKRSDPVAARFADGIMQLVVGDIADERLPATVEEADARVREATRLSREAAQIEANARRQAQADAEARFAWPGTSFAHERMTSSEHKTRGDYQRERAEWTNARVQELVGAEMAKLEDSPATTTGIVFPTTAEQRVAAEVEKVTAREASHDDFRSEVGESAKRAREAEKARREGRAEGADIAEDGRWGGTHSAFLEASRTAEENAKWEAHGLQRPEPVLHGRLIIAGQEVESA